MCLWMCHLLPKQRILIARSFIRLFGCSITKDTYDKGIQTKRENGEKKAKYIRIQQQQNTKCPLWDYKRRILKFACHYKYIYSLFECSIHTVQHHILTPMLTYFWTHSHRKKRRFFSSNIFFSKFVHCFAGLGLEKQYKLINIFKYFPT